MLSHQQRRSGGAETNHRPGNGSGAGAANAALPPTGIPVTNGRQILGKIIATPPTQQDTEDDHAAALALISIVARLISQNLGLERLLRARTGEFSDLLDLARQPPASGEIKPVAERILGGLLELTGFRVAGLFVLEPNLEKLSLRGSYAQDGQHFPHRVRKVSEASLDAQALQTGTAIYRRGSEPHNDRWLPEGIRTAVCQRVDCSAGTLGTLWVGDRRSRYVSEHDRRIVATFASLLGQTLERAVLQQESRDQQRFQREVAEIVGEPARRNRLIRHCFSGLQIAARNESHFELGGDICEIVPLNQHQVAVAIGDACGDSLPAAVVATAIRGALWTFWSNAPLADAENVSLVMECVNNAVYRLSQPHQFASLFYAVIDSRRQRLTYCNAGHPPALLLRNGHTVRLDAQGMLIGVVPNTRYSCGLLTFQPGDVLAVCTDGITEAQKTPSEIFGLNRLEAAVRRHAAHTPRQIVDAAWQALAGFTGTRQATDDRTLAVITFADA